MKLKFLKYICYLIKMFLFDRESVNILMTVTKKNDKHKESTGCPD